MDSPEWEDKGYDEHEEDQTWEREWPNGVIEGVTESGRHYVEEEYPSGIWRTYDDGSSEEVKDSSK